MNRYNIIQNYLKVREKHMLPDLIRTPMMTPASLTPIIVTMMSGPVRMMVELGISKIVLVWIWRMIVQATTMSPS
jgi:hypothetical protein